MFVLTETVRRAQVGFANDTGSVTGTTVTAASSANNEGIWVQITASTPIDANGIYVIVGGGSVPTRGLMDISIGADNDEILSDILLDWNRTEHYCLHTFFEVCIPAGSSIHARIRASAGSVTFRVAIELVQYTAIGEQYLGQIETIGTDTTAGAGASTGRLDSGGSLVDAGATINTFGAWKELSAAITYPCVKAKMISGYNTNSAMDVDIMWRVQVGVGAAGQEQVMFETTMRGDLAIKDFPIPCVFDFPFVVADGSRVCVRSSCSNAQVTDRAFECAMYLARPLES